MKQVYVVYVTDAWHSFNSRECKGIFTSKWSAVNAIVRNFDIDLDELFEPDYIAKKSDRQTVENRGKEDYPWRIGGELSDPGLYHKL